MMRRWLRRAAVYLGVRDEDDRPSSGLALLGPSLLVSGVGLSFLAAVAAATVLEVFHWNPSRLATGTAAGVLFWGSLYYFVEIRGRLPSGVLESASREGAWEPSGRRPLHGVARALLAVPFVVGLAWLADSWDLGGVFVPGQFAGYAAAALLGAWNVGRWEHRHHARVAYRVDDGERQLFTVSEARASAR